MNIFNYFVRVDSPVTTLDLPVHDPQSLLPLEVLCSEDRHREEESESKSPGKKDPDQYTIYDYYCKQLEVTFPVFSSAFTGTYIHM